VFLAVSAGKVPSPRALLLLILVLLRPVLHAILVRVGHGELLVLYGLLLALGGAELFEMVGLVAVRVQMIIGLGEWAQIARPDFRAGPIWIKRNTATDRRPAEWQPPARCCLSARPG